jgi:hypothetical protein
MKRLRLPAIALVGACIASVLAGVPAGAAPAAGALQACDLLKRAEIADVVGEDAGRPEELGVGDSSCFWELAEADGGGLVLTLFRGREARSEYNRGESLYRESDLVTVDDLGRKAFVTPLGEIWVMKNKRTVFFITGVFDAAAAEELGRLAFDRL